MGYSVNKVIKARWIAALRSGKYAQGYERLGQDDKFCCLGVLCELAYEEGVVGKRINYDGSYIYDDHDVTLPPSVRGWARMPMHEPIVVSYKNVNANVIQLNDEFMLSFDVIADVIEASR